MADGLEIDLNQCNIIDDLSGLVGRNVGGILGSPFGDRGGARPPPTTLVTKVEAFVPPNNIATPQSLYTSRIPAGAANPSRAEIADGRFRMPFPRFVRNTNADEMLIYTDGACLDNGQAAAKAGCAFVYHGASNAQGFIFTGGSRPPQGNGVVSMRLEEKGPSGQVHEQTSNRSELRAVIAALEYRIWAGEGWKRLVIATDSEYVELGMTQWLPKWKANAWRTGKKKPVKNRDLWEKLIEVVSRQAEIGCKVLFWRIPRELNVVADQAAKKGAEMKAVKEYTRLHGVMC